jgi:hypothetical protein
MEPLDERWGKWVSWFVLAAIMIVQAQRPPPAIGIDICIAARGMCCMPLFGIAVINRGCMCAGSRNPSIGIDGKGAGGTSEAHGLVQARLTGTFLPNLIGNCLIPENLAAA